MVENSEKWNKTIAAYRTYIRLEKHLADNSVEAYTHDIVDFEHFILRQFDVPPTKVEAYMIERYLAYLFENERKKSSQARILSGIKSFYNYLLLNDKIESSPTEFVEAPKVGRHLPDVLTVEEIDLIISSIDPSKPKGRRDRAMLELLYSCGLRVTELITLRICDLFFGEGYIRVVGKGNKQRLVPINATARERIMIYLDDRRERYHGNEDTLFLNNRGGKLTRIMIFTIIREAVKRTGIQKQVSPHTFRHSFATHLLAGGANIRQIQEMLGHSDISTTELYTHVDKNRLLAVHRKFHPRK